MKQSVYGDDQEAMMVRGQWANLARMPGLHPYSFSKGILGFFMTTESQDLGLTSHPNVSSVSNLYIEMSKVKKSFSSVDLNCS